MFLFIFFSIKSLGCPCSCKIIGFLHGCFSDILEGIQIVPALNLLLFEKDMSINACEHALKGQHIIFRYAAVIALDWCEEMQFRAFFEFFFDFAGRKTFIRDKDAFPDIVVTDESRIGACVNAVSRKYFRAYRFHKFNVIGI